MTDSRDSSDDWASGTAGGGAGAEMEAELMRLREALEAKAREADATHDRYVRTAAEFDNARKRAVREREELIRGANESLIRELLPVLDNFERALQAARGDAGAAAVAHAMGTHLDLFQRIVISPCSVSAVLYGVDGPVVLAVNSTGDLTALVPS